MPDSLERFRDILDRTLQEINSDYEAKRHKDITLQKLEITDARQNLFHNWLKQKGKRGGKQTEPRLSKKIGDNDEMLNLQPK